MSWQTYRLVGYPTAVRQSGAGQPALDRGGGSLRLDVTRMPGGNLDATYGRGSVHKISDSPILKRQRKPARARATRTRPFLMFYVCAT